MNCYICGSDQCWASEHQIYCPSCDIFYPVKDEENFCKSHRQEISEDEPCERCQREANDDFIYECERDRRAGL